MAGRLSAPFAVAAAVVAGVAHAERIDDRAQLGAASPDAPVFAYGGRGAHAGLGDWAMRGSLGATLSLLPASSDAFVTVSPLVELADDRGQLYLFPNQTWRGRFVAALGLRLPSNSRLSIGVEHESDHSSTHTGSVDAVLHLNAVDLHARHDIAVAAGVFAFELDARLFVGTCTRLDAGCHGASGATTFGTSGAVTFDGDAEARGLGAIVGLDGWFVAESDPIVGERRVTAVAGVALASSTGRWAILASGWLGNDVGITRASDVSGIGASLRWAAR